MHVYDLDALGVSVLLLAQPGVAMHMLACFVAPKKYSPSTSYPLSSVLFTSENRQRQKMNDGECSRLARFYGANITLERSHC